MASLRLARLLTALALGGCAAQPTSTTLSTSPTEIAVRPEDFLGAVTCGTDPGAMRSYVVTISAWDSPTDTTPFTLPSTHPTPCSTEAGLQLLVLPGLLYTAEIDGYDLPADELMPYGEDQLVNGAKVATGSRVMLDQQRNVVHPRWTSRCGLSAASATVALADQTNYLGSCERLIDHGSSPTQLRLDPLLLLASADPCNVAPSVSVDVLAGPLAALAPITCTAPPTFVPIQAGTSYRFYVHARGADGAPLGRECAVVGQAGLTVAPGCDPLASSGAVVIDLSGVVKGGQPACPPDFSYDVVAESGTLNPIPLACGTDAQIGPLAPGLHTFSVLVRDGQGKPASGGASCAADVQAGRTIQAICL